MHGVCFVSSSHLVYIMELAAGLIIKLMAASNLSLNDLLALVISFMISNMIA